MELKNMKMSDEESKEYDGSVVASKPEYPYGLQITLNDDAIDKLGLPALPQVGSTMIITARVEVCSVSQYERQDQDKERSVSLQITDMALGPDQKPSNPGEKLYGE